MLLFLIKARNSGMHVGTYRPGNVSIPSYMQINVLLYKYIYVILTSAAVLSAIILFWGRGGEGGAVAIYFSFTDVGSIQYLYNSRPPKYRGLLRFELSLFELRPFELSSFELSPGKRPLPVRPRPFNSGKKINLILRVMSQGLNSEELNKTRLIL